MRFYDVRDECELRNCKCQNAAVKWNDPCMVVFAAARHLETMAGGQVVWGVEHRERNMERAKVIGWVRAVLQGAR